MINERSKVILEIEELRAKSYAYPPGQGGRGELERNRRLKDSEERLERFVSRSLLNSFCYPLPDVLMRFVVHADMMHCYQINRAGRMSSLPLAPTHRRADQINSDAIRHRLRPLESLRAARSRSLSSKPLLQLLSLLHRNSSSTWGTTSRGRSKKLRRGWPRWCTRAMTI